MVAPTMDLLGWLRKHLQEADADLLRQLVATFIQALMSADLPAEQAAFMADSQVPWGVDALSGSITDPAWRTKPSWYLVATKDRMIPPPAQRAMSERAGSTVVEVAGSHVIYVSQPAAVAALIEQAASALAAG